jgi:hypothetical protein
MQRTLFMDQTRKYDPPPFVRIYSEGDKEFRQYSGYVAVSTREAGSYETATARALLRLLSYTNGENSDRVKIQYARPVLRQKIRDEWMVSLRLPSFYDLKNLPAPIDSRVTIRKIAPQKVAVIECGREDSIENLKTKELELLRWLGRQHDFAPVSPGRVAHYDGPLKLPILSREEIQIDVRIV